MTVKRASIFAAMMAIVGACGDDNNAKPGSERGACLPGGRCNAGLTCASNVCVRLPDAGPVDGAADQPNDLHRGDQRADGSVDIARDQASDRATDSADAAVDLADDAGIDAPADTALDGADLTTPDQSAPDQNAPDQNTPDQNARDQGAPDQSASDASDGASGDLPPATGWTVSPTGLQGETEDLATDSGGNVFAVGHFKGSGNYGGTAISSQGSSADAFVAKISSSGAVSWVVTPSSATGTVAGRAVAVDSAGNVYIAGRFRALTQIGSHTLQATQCGLFFAKLSSAGSVLWSASATNANAGCELEVASIAVDASGAVYAAGNHSAGSTFGSTVLTNPSGVTDVFVAKLSPQGQFVWASAAAVTLDNHASDIAVDATGNSYVTGGFRGDISFGTFSDSSRTLSDTDVFVAKLSAAGVVQWLATGGGDFADSGESVVLDGAALYVSGVIDGTPAVFDSAQLTTQGNGDVLVAKLAASTGQFSWAIAGGGIDREIGAHAALHPSGSLYVTTETKQQATFGTFTVPSQHANGPDAVLLEVSSQGQFVSVDATVGSATTHYHALAIDPAGSIITADDLAVRKHGP